MGDIVRVERKGRFIGWYVRYKDTDGRRRMRASHQPTQKLARRYLLEIEGRVARGLIGIPEPAPPPPTVEALVERFLVEYQRPKIKDLARYRAHARTALRRVLAILGSRGSGTLGAADIAHLREELGRRFAANSVRISLTFAATVFSWAVRASIVPDNPFKAVELPARQDLVEYLSQAESRTLLSLAADRAVRKSPAERMRHACIHLALHTGLRKGELFGLRWQDVDLVALRLTVARSFRSVPKGGKPRHLRLPSACARILAPWRTECPRTPEGLVFPVLNRSRTEPKMGESRTMLELPQLLREAGCRPLRRAWHALRHTFASHFVMSGGNILALQKILGHHDIKETMIYAHLAPDFLGDEMERVRF